MAKSAADDEARRRRIDIRGQLSTVPGYVRAEWTKVGDVLVTINPYKNEGNFPLDVAQIERAVSAVLDRENNKLFAPAYRFKTVKSKVAKAG